MPQMDLGGGMWIDTDRGIVGGGYPDEWGTMPGTRPATPAEMSSTLGYFSSPGYISGKAEADRQAAADHDFNFGGLILPSLLALSGAGIAGAFGGGLAGASGAGAGAWTDYLGGASAADAGGIAGGSAAAGGTGSLTGTIPGWENAGSPTFGGSLNVGSTAGTGATNMATDWWTELGLTPQDVGMDVGSTGSAGTPLDFSQGWNPDAPNAYDQAMRTAGIDPASPGALDTFKNWVTSNPGSAAKILGQLGSTALGMFGANQQAGALQNLANKYDSYGGPSRARFDASMTPGFDPMSIPGYKGALDSASQSILAKLSAQGGNPYGNPSGLISANKAIVSGTALPAIQEYQRMNANTGFGNSMNAAANFQGQAIGADANTLNALGYGINSLTNPQPSLADLIAMLNKSGKTNLNEGTST